MTKPQIEDAVFIDSCITKCDFIHVKVTISIPKELLNATRQASGKKGHSEAIVAVLNDYLALRKRLELLDYLFSTKLPHSCWFIKKQRHRCNDHYR
ncbi:MAG: hypothetical protein A3F82_00505 [Deltaproteobacteria bacterium RIFCSPLOWO2_12_FULL_44_12]|nr:MAG: hypothetical protein A2712_04450 [Deltaproteobacteria bacterium RIFCSPHIGHO2_01_FULL_43_49]OGQ16432.1 MAG: hypothetical protein A3D22_02415 [Deltaproteobacteria bacterium RIFCSPHIGHO2_02_FULL_44_53]OGQ27740.1 MAG: hypothetical protein A3D98_08570 [Deltaproteobacteria bacterium RIFCSPHIGHO2_12_FULL_44_21]OGQ32950.1 MAG: hypothetical protein A2979_10345 [Deltaproteobacteria bacterium RIFCSPLOWO2_01_FULL_45_74]OGQ42052.1 MAG: hypothetical protein A3I70_10135 [Deltaproteobacteria bacterium 